jgi:hypothetical protein
MLYETQKGLTYNLSTQGKIPGQGGTMHGLYLNY